MIVRMELIEEEFIQKLYEKDENIGCKILYWSDKKKIFFINLNSLHNEKQYQEIQSKLDETNFLKEALGEVSDQLSEMTFPLYKIANNQIELFYDHKKSKGRPVSISMDRMIVEMPEGALGKAQESVPLKIKDFVITASVKEVSRTNGEMVIQLKYNSMDEFLRWLVLTKKFASSK